MELDFKIKDSGIESPDRYRKKYLILVREIVIAEFFMAKVFTELFDEVLKEKGLWYDNNA